MADEQPSLHVDTDWKKQAQEEKRRLAEKAQQEEQARAASAAVTPAPSLPGAGLPGAPATPPAAPGAAAASPARAGRGARDRREMPPASIATLAQSLMTQALYYLSDVAYQGGDPVANLDMAKHQIDTLGVLEEKTADKLTDDERHALDVALHQSRSRFVNIASQFI